jgi:hypothetical protein
VYSQHREMGVGLRGDLHLVEYCESGWGVGKLCRGRLSFYKDGEV